MSYNKGMTSQNFNDRVLATAATDDAHGGYCARGVANILMDLKISTTRGDAYTWKESLPKNGWVLMKGITPENAPPGAVLVYDKNYPEGKSGGAKSGHVEIVTEVNGHRKYVSDKARDNWGGTVPGNFVGVYVHPSLASLKSDSKLPENYQATFGLDTPEVKTGLAGSPRTDQFNLAALLQNQGGNPVAAFLNLLVMLFMGGDVNKPQEPDSQAYLEARAENIKKSQPLTAPDEQVKPQENQPFIAPPAPPSRR